jgi:hypothetical protein
VLSRVLALAAPAAALAQADGELPPASPAVEEAAEPSSIQQAALFDAMEAALAAARDAPSTPAGKAAVPAPAEEGQATPDGKYKVQRKKLYYGDEKKFSRPAVLEAAKVYEKIPAYRSILDRRLTPDDPEYWPLMRKASAAFVKALKSVCSRDGYDLVGELGSIEPSDGEAAVPDITLKVTEAADGDRGLAASPETSA